MLPRVLFHLSPTTARHQDPRYWHRCPTGRGWPDLGRAASVQQPGHASGCQTTPDKPHSIRNVSLFWRNDVKGKRCGRTQDVKAQESPNVHHAGGGAPLLHHSHLLGFSLHSVPADDVPQERHLRLESPAGSWVYFTFLYCMFIDCIYLGQ